jgi:VWFA-related protein
MKKILKACVPLLCALLCSGQTKFSIDVRLVSVACTVTDRHGALVQDLKREDFVVKENGQPEPIKYFWQSSDLPLTVGIIVDVSNSQSELRSTHWARVSRFIQDALGPRDHGFIATIGPQARLLTALDASSDDLLHAINPFDVGGSAGTGELLGGACGTRTSIRADFPCGGTALWHGLYYALWLGMRNAKGRKALVLISDGWDTGSDKSLQEVIRAAEETDTLIYSIHYVSQWAWNQIAKQHKADFERTNPRNDTIESNDIENNILMGAGALEKLSLETGGRRFEGSDQKLDRIFAEIEEELRTEYVLAYAPPRNTRKGQFHKISVRTIRPDLDVRTRTGYYAW